MSNQTVNISGLFLILRELGNPPSGIYAAEFLTEDSIKFFHFISL